MNLDAAFNFNFGTSAAPLPMKLLFEVQAGITGTVMESNPDFTVDGEPVDECYCCDNDGALEFPSEGNCEYFLESGGSLSPISSPIPATSLECGVEQCVKAICSDPATPMDCLCPPCGNLQYRMTVTRTFVGNVYTLVTELIGVNSADVVLSLIHI